MLMGIVTCVFGNFFGNYVKIKTKTSKNSPCQSNNGTEIPVVRKTQILYFIIITINSSVSVTRRILRLGSCIHRRRIVRKRQRIMTYRVLMVGIFH
jgi:hypothetical protein